MEVGGSNPPVYHVTYMASICSSVEECYSVAHLVNGDITVQKINNFIN